MQYKIILLSFFFVMPFLSKTSESQNLNTSSYSASDVYICSGSTAKKYHFSKNCRGLNNCKHQIKKVTLSDAKVKYRRTLCGWED